MGKIKEYIKFLVGFFKYNIKEFEKDGTYYKDDKYNEY